MAKVVLIKITTPEGNEAIAIEITTEGEQTTIALEGSVVQNDAALLTKVNDLIQFVKDKQYG